MFQTLDDLLKSYKRKKNPFENKLPLKVIDLILFCVIHASVIHLSLNCLQQLKTAASFAKLSESMSTYFIFTRNAIISF